MKTTSLLKVSFLTIATTGLISSQAFAQTNHNTTGSSKRPGGVTAPQGTNSADIEVKLTTIGGENTANGHQALSPQGEPTGNRGGITNQKERLTTLSEPSVDITDFCKKFSEAELKSARKECNNTGVIEPTETHTLCGCTHL